jgi:hypothetical protein
MSNYLQLQWIALSVPQHNKILRTSSDGHLYIIREILEMGVGLGLSPYDYFLYLENFFPLISCNI